MHCVWLLAVWQNSRRKESPYDGTSPNRVDAIQVTYWYWIRRFMRSIASRQSLTHDTRVLSRAHREPWQPRDTESVSGGYNTQEYTNTPCPRTGQKNQNNPPPTEKHPTIRNGAWSAVCGWTFRYTVETAIFIEKKIPNQHRYLPRLLRLRKWEKRVSDVIFLLFT